MGETMVEMDLLIVGAGPAGSALACFLASYGRTGIMIAAAPGTAATPRAHITNMAALECLRDIGLEEECLQASSDADHMKHTRWCRSMAGEEYARIHAWGNDPRRVGDYDVASPCSHVDLPQTKLEPILNTRAAKEGWLLRFSTSFISFSRPSPDVIISTVRDEVTKMTYNIKSKYLFGCDGARSQIVRQLEIPLIRKPGQGFALNFLVKADLSQHMATRSGNLHWIFDPNKEYPGWGQFTILRMVKPWHEWMFIVLPAPGMDVSTIKLTDENGDYLARVKEWIGDDSIDTEILDISKWTINEIVAERYSDGNIFCLGDAVHRHPPFNGLGSNTCIQDAFNIAWKIDHVMSGKADSKLLDSFNKERQPVGVDVISRANQGLRDHSHWIETIGMTEPDLEKRRAIWAEFDDPGEKGKERRKMFQRDIEHTSTEYHGLGVEMNQRYVSEAVYQQDETGPAPLPEDKIKYHLATTYPGCRLPHAWLNSRIPGKLTSTIDLAGHGHFCLITGASGQAWKHAAQEVSKRTGIEIGSYTIGWKQDFEDVYFDWAKRQEVEEDGCVLVRPDRVVAWRSHVMIPDCASKLEKVVKAVLALK